MNLKYIDTAQIRNMLASAGIKTIENYSISLSALENLRC
jgi:hypothetical protein